MPQPGADLDLIWVFLYYIGASHGSIPKAHMNEHTLLNNVMTSLA